MTSRQDPASIYGAVEGLLLKAVSWGPRHGFAISQWIRQTSRDELAIEDRALYLALHRMEERGWLRCDWGLSENNRKAKYYELTAKGRAQLRAETTRLTRYATALERILAATRWEAAT